MNLDATLFLIAMLCDMAGFLGYVLSASLARDTLYRWARRAFWAGALLALAGLLARWYQAGYPPLSNMYESMVTLSTFLAWIALLFTRTAPIPLAEAGGAVVAVLMIGIGSLFAKDTRPLVPALQSYWLHLHVAVAFLGEAAFALSFVLSYLFCLRRFLEDPAAPSRGFPPPTGPERLACAGIVFGLPGLFLLAMAGLAWKFAQQPHPDRDPTTLLLWVILPVAATLAGLVVAAVQFRGAVSAAMDRWLPPADLLDDYTYRAIALGYPLFTVGALIFGMVWANKAWGRYWGWDPKETWALITFLVYSIYLHVRLTRGWQGTWTAILSVLGFLVTMFTLFGVNLLLSGLHSYATL
ncbi:MAG: Cytochrome c-type biogenesis protein CcsA/ResC [Candidatus Ozemobacter sibiricus]|uniref:Cytochrome c-type biogenesis protein CcsA/ResC n=1 Tax=Candidatus Ozemobacter sibiricus TaxID=2268124 RepID=A0A367ZP17_9BACT|nr:MAG: Cytochrome c-type biogenesis protein CcsA/ResC [Candidatus Ozemobacter sibiricus]